MRRRNLTIVRSLSRILWQSSISFLSTDTPLVSNIWLTFSSRFCSRIDVAIPSISKHSLREYWAFDQHYRSASTDFLSKRLLTVLTILTSSFKYTSLNSEGCMHRCLYMHPTIIFLPEEVCVLMKVDFSSFSCICWDLFDWYNLTVCSCHVTYASQRESTLYSCLNVKELLTRSRREIWRWSDWPNGWVFV